MIAEALMIAFGLAGIGLWYLGIEGRDIAYFRFIFIVFGFLCFIGAFASMATFLSAYIGTDFTNASVNGLNGLAYAYMYGMGVAMFIYMAIEIILYFGRVAALARQKKDNPYDFQER